MNVKGERPIRFQTTQWSIVLAARDNRTATSQDALATLCQTYWHPLYVYVRSRGYSVEEAQDLTQEFFANLLEKNYLKKVQQDRGRFRTFLLAVLKNFLANEWDKSMAKKRGGGQTRYSLDLPDPSEWREAEIADGDTPEKLYERRWALTLLEKVLMRLRQEYERSGKGVLFDALKGSLTSESSRVPYKELRNRLGMREGAIKVAAYRLRTRYGALIRSEIAETVEREENIEAELRDLLAALEN